MHKITLDRIHKLMELRLSGAAAIDDIRSAGAAARQAVQSLGTPTGAHVSLYDLCDTESISEAAIERAFDEWADPRFTCVRARKVAVVAPYALSHRRLARLSESRPGLSVFKTRTEAMRWLLT